MAFNLGKKLSALFAGSSGQDNQPASSVYAKASPEQKTEFEACLERLVTAGEGLKTLMASPEYKALPYAEGEYAVREKHRLLDESIQSFNNIKAGKMSGFGVDMTETINALGQMAENVERLGKSITKGIDASKKTAAPAKPAQPCCA